MLALVEETVVEIDCGLVCGAEPVVVASAVPSASIRR